ncbi:MAG: heavy metal sensor histidine kinase [Candidatus Anammoxibacter sp.]
MYSKNKIKFFKRIGFKITLWYLLSVLIIITIVGFSFYYHLQRTLGNEIDSLLLDEIADIIPGKPENDLDLDDLKVAIERETSGRKLHKISARLLDLDKNVIVTSPNFFVPLLQMPEKVGANVKENMETIETIRINNTNNYYRLLTKPIFHNGSQKYFLQIAIFMKGSYKVLEKFKENILMYIPGIIIITIIGGWFISRRSLAPIGHIIKSANAITASNLNKRLKPINTGDELEELTKTINLMLNRLEESFKKNVQFTADASHELRTPITGLKAGTEVILAKERSAEEYRDLHESNLIAFEEITRMIHDLFVLLKSDYGLRSLNHSNFMLNSMLKELHSSFCIISDEKGINFMILKSEPVQISGDEMFLKRLFSNIIDNAIKYTPNGKRIYLSIEERNGNAVVSIKDEGKGLSEENKSRIFDRFFRVDQSRSRGTGGAGLGLSICKNIVELHNGTIEVKSKLGVGSTFIVTIPKDGIT